MTPEALTETAIDLEDGGYAWVCDRCGQLLPEHAVCNSGYHVGPDGGNQGAPIRTDDLSRRLRAAETALQQIKDQQPKTLAMIESNGFVFTDIGREPGNWQHLAFSVYTDLCEVDSVARAYLEGQPE